jgi:hypothetical protein
MRRRTVLRIGGWVFVSIAVAAGLGACYPGGLSAFVGDVRDYDQNHTDLAHEQAAEHDINAALSDRHERHQLLTQLRDGLVAGRVRLPVAADEYLSAVAADPELLAQFRVVLPGGNDEERMAVALLREVFVSSPLSSAEREDFLRQFHTAYAAHYPLPVPGGNTSRVVAEHSSQP